MISFKILGTCAGTGVPSFFCECAGCMEARQNPEYARTRTGAFIDTGNRKILIDAPPDIRSQLVRESINSIDVIFLTHWHADHYAGLGEFEYYVRLLTKEPLTIFMPPSAVHELPSAFPDLTDIFHIIPWQYEQEYQYGEISLTPLKANHGVETAGFLVKANGKRLAYFPDTAGLPVETAKRLECIDYFICDATFHGENWFPHSHMNVEEAVALGRSIQAKHTILTHLSIHYSQPTTTAQLKEKLSNEPDISIAYDGLKIEI